MIHIREAYGAIIEWGLLAIFFGNLLPEIVAFTIAT